MRRNSVSALWIVCLFVISAPFGCASPESAVYGKVYPRGSNHTIRAVESIDVSSDGTLLAVALDKQAVLWNIATQEQVHVLQCDDLIDEVHFCEDGSVLLTAGKDKTLRFWDIQTGKQLRSIRKGDFWFSPLAVFAESKQAATLETDGNIHLWDLASGKEIKSFPGPAQGIQDIVFTADAKYLIASSNEDNLITFWDIATGKKVRDIVAETYRIAITPDGRFLAYRDDDTIVLWDVPGKKQNRILKPRTPSAGYYAMAFSRDGKRLAAAEIGGGVRVWDIADGKEIACFRGPFGDGLCVAFSPDGKYVFSGGHRDATVRRWTLPE